MTRFADQLLTDLLREHGATLSTIQRLEPEPVKARHRARVAGALVGAAAAATTGIVLFTGGSPAYALTDNANGSVTLEINRPAGIEEANRAFAARGDRVVVVPVSAGCPDIGTLVGPPSPGSTTTSTARENGSAIDLDVQGIPAGRTALVGVEHSGETAHIGMALISGTAPECVSLPDGPRPGTGDQRSELDRPADDGAPAPAQHQEP